MRLCCLDAARALKTTKSSVEVDDDDGEEVALSVREAAAAIVEVAVLGVWILDVWMMQWSMRRLNPLLGRKASMLLGITSNDFRCE